MAADVLLYNSLNEVNRCLIQQDATLTANIAAQNALCQQAINDIANNAVAIVCNSGPNQANMWCLIPTLPATGCSWTSGFTVCDTSGNFRCGASCSWTVPGGVTCARFQLWGAGAGSGSACCCGFSPFGGTGAYASVIIPVTAGDTYILCAGCAMCCYACRSPNIASGCPSYASGPAFTNFCAEGGEGNKYCEAVTRCICGPTSGWCMYLGGCICNSGSDICWGTSGPFIGSPGYCWDNMWPSISSCKAFFGSATGGTIYGIRGSFGQMAVTCDSSICATHPPIYGFGSSSCCVACIASNYNGGCCFKASAGYLQIPGAGGWATMKCGGATSLAGDAGRMGMVCVSFR